MGKAIVKIGEGVAGILTEDEQGYSFQYTQEYLTQPNARPISLTLPLAESPHTSPVRFPFFDGLIPAGWLLELSQRNWKIDGRDRMALLLRCCRDCTGNVQIYPLKAPTNT